MAVYNGMLNTTTPGRTRMKIVRHPAKFLAAWIVALVQVGAVHADAPRQPEILVFAAASLTNVLGDLSADWQRASGVTVKLSFAASSVLARQIEAGGKADVFVSADQEWMDYLQSRGLIEKPTRRDLVGNRLVLIAPSDSKIELKIAPGFPLMAALGSGRLATGDPDTVPGGPLLRAPRSSRWASGT
jgi:molybdate transport system substrate-binding protein